MSKAKYHHLIAQTYLRSWTHGKDSLYAFDRDNNKLIGTKNISKNFGITNFHTIKAGMPICTDNDLKTIFSALNGYTVTYNGSVISSMSDYNRFYYDFLKWIITNSTGVNISKAEKNKLKTTIDQTKILDIEEKWSKDYEDGWGNLREIIKQRVRDARTANIPEFYKGKLMKFIVSMDWRSFSSNEHFVQSFQALNDITKLNEVKIPFSERTLPTNDTVLKENTHYYLLNLFRDFLNGEGLMYSVAKHYIKHLNIIFLVSKEKNAFITSDNPSFTYKDDFGVMHMMPITPQIVAIIGSDSEKTGNYELRYASSKDIRKVNRLIVENAYRIVVGTERKILI